MVPIRGSSAVAPAPTGRTRCYNRPQPRQRVVIPGISSPTAERSRTASECEYAMSTDQSNFHCPSCTSPTGSRQLICFHCGYDLRQRSGWSDELRPPVQTADPPNATRWDPWFEWWRIGRWLRGRGSNPSRYGVTRREARDIIAAIRSTPGMDERVVHMYRKGPDLVTVHVGVVCGPLAGGGDIITARRSPNGWDCERAGSWES